MLCLEGPDLDRFGGFPCMHTLEEIARATGLSLAGDGSIVVDRPCSPDTAGPRDLALALAPTYAECLSNTPARAAVVWQDADWQSFGLDGVLLAPRARVALAQITDVFQHAPDVEAGVHRTAEISADARIGSGARIGPFVTLGPGAVIGRNAVIGPGASIGADVVVGDNARIDAGVRIGARCRLGNDLIVQSNAVVGSDGFSFEPPERGAVESARETGALSSAVPTRSFLRIHSIAAVEIGDDVEIGAATTIDRGTIAPTRIGSGTKIDNQVQIGHNVQIGQTCLLCAQVGIAGSTTIGDRVVLGGKTGIGDHLKIGSDVVCAGGTLVASNIPDGSVMMGIPATNREQAARQIVAVRRLPRLIKQVEELRKKLGL